MSTHGRGTRAAGVLAAHATLTPHEGETRIAASPAAAARTASHGDGDHGGSGMGSGTAGGGASAPGDG